MHVPVLSLRQRANMDWNSAHTMTLSQSSSTSQIMSSTSLCGGGCERGGRANGRAALQLVPATTRPLALVAQLLEHLLDFVSVDAPVPGTGVASAALTSALPLPSAPLLVQHIKSAAQVLRFVFAREALLRVVRDCHASTAADSRSLRTLAAAWASIYSSVRRQGLSLSARHRCRKSAVEIGVWDRWRSF